MSTAIAQNETPAVLRHDAEGVATLTLNRAGGYNTLSTAMIILPIV